METFVGLGLETRGILGVVHFLAHVPIISYFGDLATKKNLLGTLAEPYNALTKQSRASPFTTIIVYFGALGKDKIENTLVLGLWPLRDRA